MEVKGSLFNGPPGMSPIAKNADVNGMGHSMYGTGCKLAYASCASEPAAQLTLKAPVSAI